MGVVSGRERRGRGASRGAKDDNNTSNSNSNNTNTNNTHINTNRSPASLSKGCSFLSVAYSQGLSLFQWISTGVFNQGKWEVLQGIRLLGTTFGHGLSDRQAATAQMHSVEQTYRRVPTPLGSTSPFSDQRHVPRDCGFSELRHAILRPLGATCRMRNVLGRLRLGWLKQT